MRSRPYSLFVLLMLSLGCAARVVSSTQPAAGPRNLGVGRVLSAAQIATDPGDVGDGQFAPSNQGGETILEWILLLGGAVLLAVFIAVLVRENQAAFRRQVEAFRQIASDNKADFSEDPLRVQFHVKEWTISLDMWRAPAGRVTTGGVRMRAPYVAKDAFRFLIFSKDYGWDPESGMPDVTIGDPEFDKPYVIQGTDESKLRALLANPKIREVYPAQIDFRLEIQDESLPAGVYQLSYVHTGVITNVDRLQSLLEMFEETLKQLCVIGSASETKPNVEH